MRPNESFETFWKEVADILDQEDGASNTWLVFCELASHLSREIEALLPGQDGERIACYAWWLTYRLGRLVASNESRAKHFEERILASASQFSYFRSSLTKSPVIPSAFLHATTDVRSVWAMSLLAQLSLSCKTLLRNSPSESIQTRISKALHGYLLASTLADSREGRGPAVFAYEENQELTCLCENEGFISEDMGDALGKLIILRRDISRPPEIRARLEALAQVAPHEVHLTLLVVKDAIHTTTECDSALEIWLDRSEQVVEFLRCAPDAILEPVLDAFAEFQQRPMTRWTFRLPHLLAYVIEQLDDPVKVSTLSTALIQMSFNAGVVSPILRIVSSNKWCGWHDTLATWRENLLEVGRYSEPWIAARVRPMLATISRLIGPRNISGLSSTGREETGSSEGSASA